MPAGEEQGQHLFRETALFHYGCLESSLCPRRGKRWWASPEAALISKGPEGGREDVLPWVARLETRVGGWRNGGGGLFT